MHDRHRDPRFLRGGIDGGDALPARAKEFHAADCGQTSRQTIHAITNVSLGSVGPRDVAREMVVGCPARATLVPPAEATILLVAFNFTIRADNFMYLIHRPFELRRRDPVVLEVKTHSVLKIDPHLDGVVGVYAFAQQTFLL